MDKGKDTQRHKDRTQRWTKAQGQNSKMDKGKGTRHKDRTQRWTKEKVHKGTRTDKGNGT
jgi:hypothetical protein